MPTKVMLHKKGSKQYMNLAVVQELYAHTGTGPCSCFDFFFFVDLVFLGLLYKATPMVASIDDKSC